MPEEKELGTEGRLLSACAKREIIIKKKNGVLKAGFCRLARKGKILFIIEQKTRPLLEPKANSSYSSTHSKEPKSQQALIGHAQRRWCV
jgi:hypothetical protein